MKRLFSLSALLVLASILSTSFTYGQSCDTLRNYVKPTNNSYTTWQEGPTGMILGQYTIDDSVDEYNLDMWVEPYNVGTSTTNIKGFNILPSVIQNISGTATFTMVIYNDIAGEPGTLLASQIVNYADLNDEMFWSTILLDNPVSVTGKFYVGYQLSYATPWNKFQLAATESATNYTLLHFDGPAGSFFNNEWRGVDELFTSNGAPINSAFALDVLTSNGTEPVADFTIDYTSACLSGSFEVDATLTTGSVDSYQWYLTNPSLTSFYDSKTGNTATLSPSTIIPSSQWAVLVANGACTSSGVYIPVTIAADVNATVASTNASCGNANGSITISGATGGIGSYLYSIDGGTNTGPTGTFNNLVAGTYTIEVSTDGNGCTYTETVTITDLPGETITVGPSGGTICAGATANLTASGNGTIEWFVGGTSVGNGTSLAVTPATTTVYDVVLTDANGCTDAGQVTVNVTPQEDASFAYPSSTMCLGGANSIPTISGTQGGTFTTTGTGLVISSSTGEVNLSTSVAGTYTVTYATSGTCSNSQNTTITLTESPDASFTYANTEYCSNEGIITPVFATGASAGTFSSTTGLSITAGSGNIDLGASAAGTYTVTNSITASGSCPATLETFEITVNASPTVDAGQNQSICEGGNVTLTANASAGTVTWDNSVVDGQAFTPTGTTTYTVTTDNNGCTATDNVTVTVNAFPTVDAGQNQTVCEGESVTLTATASAGTVTWDNSIVDGQAFTATETTTFTVTADNNGCTNTDNVTVTVNALPTIDAGQNQAVCEGESVTLTATASAGTVTWDNSVVDGQAFVPTATTTYTVTTDDNGCTATDNVTVTVNALPTVDAGGNIETCINYEAFALTGTPTGGTFSGTGVTNNSFDPETAGIGTHTITYTYSDAEGCENTATMQIEVDGCAGISGNELNNQFLLSPNPSADYIDVTVTGNYKVNSIQLVSLEGKVIAAKTIMLDNQVQRIDISSLSKGTYLVQLSTDYGTITKKVVVQ